MSEATLRALLADAEAEVRELKKQLAKNDRDAAFVLYSLVRQLGGEAYVTDEEIVAIKGTTVSGRDALRRRTWFRAEP